MSTTSTPPETTSHVQDVPTASAPASSERLQSLDTLRGFDMFWITGGAMFVRTLSEQTDWEWVDRLAEQMHHKWHGFHFYDLIFPLFMFIAGVAIPYSLMRKLEQGTAKSALYIQVAKRAAILVVLGAIYNGGLRLQFDDLRVASVLGQIGLAYLIAALIAVNCRSVRAIALWVIGILAAIAAIHLLIPVPGHGAGVFTGEGSINGYIDRMLLPGKLHGTTMDPEGILCIISASAITLMGTLAGKVLSGGSRSLRDVAILCAIGLPMIPAALVMDSHYPIIKSFWTSTFNLLAGGISFILLALFYLVIDVWGFRKWTLFFRVIGLNSITIYLGVKFIDFRFTSNALFGGFAARIGECGPVLLVVGTIALQWCVLYFLHRKRIYLKV